MNTDYPAAPSDTQSSNPFETESVQIFTESQIETFREFSRTGDVYSRLVNSFAPSIWEMEDVKKGILCQLFGGTSKKQQVVPFFSYLIMIVREYESICPRRRRGFDSEQRKRETGSPAK
jgi:hypothetical protein